MQAVERPARRRAPARLVLRQHAHAVGLDVAARALRGDAHDPRRARADAEPGRGGAGRGAGPLGVHVRRLQALHERGLPGRVPDGRADPHRVRHRDRAARRLQRLRLLHSVVPVRRDRSRPVRRARREVHAVLRPARGRAGAGVREGVPDRLDPVRALRRAGRAGQGARGDAGGARDRGRVPVRRRATGRATTWPAASARSSCSPSRRRSTACPPRRTRRSSRTGRSRTRPGSRRRSWPSAWRWPRSPRRTGGASESPQGPAARGRDAQRGGADHGRGPRRHARRGRARIRRRVGARGGEGRAREGELGRRALVVPLRQGHPVRGRGRRRRRGRGGAHGARWRRGPRRGPGPDDPRRRLDVGGPGLLLRRRSRFGLRARGRRLRLGG